MICCLNLFFHWRLQNDDFANSVISSAFNSWNFFKRFYLCIFRERGREGKERERNIHVWEIHLLVASHTPPTGEPSPKSRHVPRLGIEPVTLCFTGWHPVHWATGIFIKWNLPHQLFGYPEMINSEKFCLYGKDRINLWFFPFIYQNNELVS